MDLIEIDLMYMVSTRTYELSVKNQKTRQLFLESPQKIVYAKDTYRNLKEINKKCFELYPNTYQNASRRVKINVELALYYSERRVSLYLVGEQLRNKKKIELLAVETNPKNSNLLISN